MYQHRSRTSDTGLSTDVASPRKISLIQEGLGGRYDNDTIVGMLRQCRGDIDRAFVNLLDDADLRPSSNRRAMSPFASNTTSSSGPPSISHDFRSLLPSSRSSSRHSSGSKRSANDDSDDDDRFHSRRTRGRDPKRRVLPNASVGMGSRTETRDDLLSPRLRISAEAATDPSFVDVLSSDNADSVTSEKPSNGRKQRIRNRSSPSITVTESEESSQSTSTKQSTPESLPIPDQKAT
jgi:hypothetical protein